MHYTMKVHGGVDVYMERLWINQIDFFAYSLWSWQQQMVWHISPSSPLHQLYDFQGHMANSVVGADCVSQLHQNYVKC
jgi:hypothetical protein